MSSAFGRRELGQVLSTEVEAAGRIDRGIDVTQHKFEPRVQPQKKVERYRPGQAPKWAKEDDEGTGGVDLQAAAAARRRQSKKSLLRREGTDPNQKVEAEVLVASSSDDESDGDGDGRAGAETQSRKGGMVVISAVPADGDDDDDDEVAARRARVKARLRARAAARKAEEEEGGVAGVTGDAGGSGQAGGSGSGSGSGSARAGVGVGGGGGVTLGGSLGGIKVSLTGIVSTSSQGAAREAPQVLTASALGISSSEEESGSESESEDEIQLLKPTFVRKEDRVTIQERERQEAEEAAKFQAKEKLKEARALESKKLVADLVVREAEEAEKANASSDDESGRPDDKDREEEKEDDMQAWALRELKRIKAEREVREAAEREAAETERRRNLTEAERAAEDKELEKQGLKVFKKEKKKIGFMQKYRHRGAFYMDEDSLAKDDVRKRDISDATGADKFNKAALPSVMQVRGDDFGKRSRTKWTHLAAEDTTRAGDGGNAWTDLRNPLRRKMEKSLAGTGDIDTAGRVQRGKRKSELEDMGRDSQRRRSRE